VECARARHQHRRGARHMVRLLKTMHLPVNNGDAQAGRGARKSRHVFYVSTYVLTLLADGVRK
jgi:hypothetical protein